MAKVLISDKLAQEGIAVLKSEPDFQVDVKTGLKPEELSSIIGDYQAIVVRSETKLTKDIIDKAQNLKVIGRAGVGLDNVDLEEATQRGIIVMNAPSGNTISTCEQAFALILSLSRNIAKADASVREGKWERSKFKGVELYGKTLGIIGLGRIGREVAKRALSFGMRVISFDPFISEDVAKSIDAELVDLERLLKSSDYITIHTALTDETENMISHKEFSLMKPTARIINSARGGIIDEKALCEALKDKKIAGAALDVYGKEPPEKNDPLFGLDNIVLSPHLGASTQEAQVNVAVEIAECVRDALYGRSLRNAVNFPTLEPEVWQVLSPYIGLAEKMGLISSQLIKGRVKEVVLTYAGEFISFNLAPVSSAVVKGLLSPVMEETVNFVNSLNLAKERGIKVEVVKSSEGTDYVNSVSLLLKSDKERVSLEGTLFANKSARIVKINDFYLEVVPSEFMVFIENRDKPGVIGKLGTILGKHQINIASMGFGRKQKGGDALTVLTVDSPLTEEIVKEILSGDDKFISLKFIKA
ncbi:MAG: phosphoglycerate dehydrogenase [Candidatus Omnitrophica bacterium]|nr:phosphoglycerate dehydrogenase [Candidatus Omnitrophota bacterium]